MKSPSTIQCQSFHFSTRGEKHRERVPWVLVGADDAVRHLQLSEEFSVPPHEFFKPLQIFFSEAGRVHGPASARFQILEDFGVREREVHFISVEDLEYHDLMAMKTELLEAKFDVVGRLEQVREKQDHTAAMDEADGIFQQHSQSRPTRGAQG